MSLDRRLANLETEALAPVELDAWCALDGQSFSPSPALRRYVEQQAGESGPWRLAVWVETDGPCPLVCLLAKHGSGLQLVEVPPELAGEDGP